MTSPTDPVVAAITDATRGASPAQIVAGLEGAGVSRANMVRYLTQRSPWSAQGNPKRWKATTGAGGARQMLAGDPGVRVVELVDTPGRTASTLFVYEPDPGASVGDTPDSPLRGMTCVRSVEVAAPDDDTTAWTIMEGALTTPPVQ